MAVSDLGCGAGENALKSRVIELLQKDKSPYATAKKMLELDTEGYYVGSLAAFILRYIDKGADWRTQIETGVSPVDLALKGRAPLDEPSDEKLKSAYDDAAASANQKIGAILDPELALYKDPSSVHVVMGRSILISTYSPSGFYLPSALPGMSVAPLAFPLKTDDVPATLNLAPEKAIFFELRSDAPCRGMSFVIPAPSAKFADHSISFSADKASGAFRGTLAHDAAEKTWFCGE